MACVVQWAAEDVASWVEQCLKLPYGEAFREAGVDGAKLVELDQERLAALGVVDSGHLLRILSHVAVFRSQLGQPMLSESPCTVFQDAEEKVAMLEEKNKAAMLQLHEEDARAAAAHDAAGHGGDGGPGGSPANGSPANGSPANGSLAEDWRGGSPAYPLPTAVEPWRFDEVGAASAPALCSPRSLDGIRIVQVPDDLLRPLALGSTMRAARPQPAAGAYPRVGSPRDCSSPSTPGRKRPGRGASRGAGGAGSGGQPYGSPTPGSTSSTRPHPSRSRPASAGVGARPCVATPPSWSADRADRGDRGDVLAEVAAGGPPSSAMGSPRCDLSEALSSPRTRRPRQQASSCSSLGSQWRRPGSPSETARACGSEFGTDLSRGASFGSSPRLATWAPASPGPGPCCYSPVLRSPSKGNSSPKFAAAPRRTMECMQVDQRPGPGAGKYNPSPRSAVRGGSMGTASRWRAARSTLKREQDQSPGPTSYFPRHHYLSGFK